MTILASIIVGAALLLFGMAFCFAIASNRYTSNLHSDNREYGARHHEQTGEPMPYDTASQLLPDYHWPPEKSNQAK